MTSRGFDVSRDSVAISAVWLDMIVFNGRCRDCAEEINKSSTLKAVSFIKDYVKL
jgi:hypothetical protein